MYIIRYALLILSCVSLPALGMQEGAGPSNGTGPSESPKQLRMRKQIARSEEKNRQEKEGHEHQQEEDAGICCSDGCLAFCIPIAAVVFKVMSGNASS